MWRFALSTFPTDTLVSFYSPKDELPEATAGFFSLMTYAWLTPIMWKINRKGTDFLQHMRCPDVNRAEINAERLEGIVDNVCYTVNIACKFKILHTCLVDLMISSELFYICRLDRIWKEELKAKGPEKASFARTLWKASRTRVIIGGLTFIISMSFSFAAPVWVYSYQNH